jgi:hypothetical protein
MLRRTPAMAAGITSSFLERRGFGRGNSMTNFQELREAIHHLHGATAAHVESVSVRETHNGEILWDGVVEVFDLAGHPKANRIYAWSRDTDDPKHPRQDITVLHIPPVVSPKTAVQAVILQEYEKRSGNKDN